MKMFRKIHFYIFIYGAIVLAAAGSVSAEETQKKENGSGAAAPYTMDEMVVSASKVEEAIATIPKHVTVITGQDIRESAGSNIIDLLGREAGIHIRSNSGTDKHSVVDLRGMGDAASSNVIVMVDGLSINSPDMSGPSISTVPLEQIERIEIVRGAGSVVYGSGAVGGVVNIITRRPGEHPTGGVYFSYGSYDTFHTRASFGGKANENLGVNLSAGFFDSDGYRDNGFLRKKDIDGKAFYDLTDSLSFLLAGTYYEDKYGLPGTVSRRDVSSRARRMATNFPDDFGESTEIRGTAGIDADLAEWGSLTLKRGYSLRDNEYLIGYNAAIAKGDQKTEAEEDTRKLDLNYVNHYTLFGRFHMIQLGVDHYRTEYIRENAYDGIRKNSETESLGVFINNQWELSDKLLLTAGTRYNTYQGRFRTDEKKFFAGNARLWVNGSPVKKEWNNNAWTLGASWAIATDTAVFASYNTSFRIPNVDEFAESEPGLKPQEGRHIEIGGRQHFGTLATLAVSLFDIRIEDEIYYSDINRNYDDTTIRRGIEADIKFYPVYTVNLWGTYTYTDATFDGKNTTVPLVPAHMLSAGVQWLPIESFRLSLSGTYTGSSFDGNDTDNDAYAKIDDYTVFDIKASYEHKNLTVFAGINNIFDTLYATSAYSEQYYPMPERNVFGGFKWTFR